MQTAISCVIDHDPRFLTQARLLLASLRMAGVRQDDASTVLVVHVPQVMADAPELAPLRQLGALIQPYQAFAAGPGAYCNKLVQFQTGALRQADRVLLLDADMLILRDPRVLFDMDAVRAKIVDFPLPRPRNGSRCFRRRVLAMSKPHPRISAHAARPRRAIAMAVPITCPGPPLPRWPRPGRAGRAIAWPRVNC